MGAHCDTGAVEQQPPTAPPPPSYRTAIDIKPGSDPNTMNCRNAVGPITIAVLTTDSFDATTADHRTVIFAGARETHLDKKTGEPIRHMEDVNGDDLGRKLRKGGETGDPRFVNGRPAMGSQNQKLPLKEERR